MTSPPPTKSRSSHDGAPTAPQPVDTAAVSAPKVAARKGVPSTLTLRTEKFRSDQARHSTLDPTPDQPGIRIYAPPVYRHHWDGARWSKRQGDTAKAAYACSCGQTGTATGAPKVAALAAEYAAHKSDCTGVPVTLAERRAAA